MTNLSKANQELYRRTPDETFATMQAIWDHCYRQREQSVDRWHPPSALSVKADNFALSMNMGRLAAVADTKRMYQGRCAAERNRGIGR